MKAASLLVIALILSAPAQAFYCNEKLVTAGDHETAVRTACGDPVSVHRYVIYVVREILPVRRAPGPLSQRESLGHAIQPAVQYVVPIMREEWLYNFGSARFLQRLTFQNGYLREIDTAGYGF